MHGSLPMSACLQDHCPGTAGHLWGSVPSSVLPGMHECNVSAERGLHSALGMLHAAATWCSTLSAPLPGFALLLCLILQASADRHCYVPVAACGITSMCVCGVHGLHSCKGKTFGAAVYMVMQVLHREHAAGLYSKMPFAVSLCCVEIPYNTVAAAIFSCVGPVPSA